MKSLLLNISLLLSFLTALFYPTIDVVVSSKETRDEPLLTPLVSELTKLDDPRKHNLHPFDYADVEVRLPEDNEPSQPIPIEEETPPLTPPQPEDYIGPSASATPLPKTDAMPLPDPYRQEIERRVGILSYQLEDKHFHFITDPTDSFKHVVDIARRKPNSILIDRHFNAGGGFGYLTIPNPQAMGFAELLNAEYEKIYKAKNWQRSNYNLDVSLTHKFQILSYAARYGQASVIDEFGFIDDSRNGSAVIEWMMSQEGQDEIAKATIRAALKSTFTHIFLSAGHWGPRGTVGANYKGFHETDYSFAIFSSMATALKLNDTQSLLESKPETNNWGYKQNETEENNTEKDTKMKKSNCKI